VLDSIKIIRDRVGSEVPIIGGLEGPVTLASDLVSVKSVMNWSIKKSGLMRKVLDFATDVTIAYANSMVIAGADAIAVADPLASPYLMNPDSFKNELQPRLQRFSSQVNSVTVLHICSDVSPILNYMADCGFEGLSVDENVGSIKKDKELIGDRARLVGNISSPFVLLPGPIEKIKEESKKIKQAREEGSTYRPMIYANGDTKKQLLARSRYLLFKTQTNWGKQQKERAEILFAEFPKIKEAYNLSMMFRACYEQSHSVTEAKEKLTQWYEKVKEKDFDSFITAAESIRWRETTILNYFIDRSTNASAESFNAKLKSFRSVVRGVRDRAFHLFRVAKLYA